MTVHRAAVLGELAERIGVPAQALADTVAQHNTAIASGGGAELRPPRSGKGEGGPASGGYVGGLSKAAVLGLRAAESAARVR